MSRNASADNVAPVLLSDVAFKLQTIVPSAIKKRGPADGPSGSTMSTLRGSQSKTLSVSDALSLPDGWTRVRHPDSGVYYVNEDRGLSTSSDVLHAKTRALLTRAADALCASPAWRALLEDQEADLVLDVQLRGGTASASYYCVSHAERRIFWLEGVGHEAVDIPCTSSKCVRPKGSRVHCVEAQYWRHCELFPTTFAVTKDVTGYLKDVLLLAAADRLMVKFSTSPYDKDALEYMLNIVKEIENGREGSDHAACIIARFMGLDNDGLFESSYGQSDDFFDIEDTGPAIGPYQRPPLLAIFAPLFFKSPEVYAVELHSFHENFTPERWSSFVRKVDQSIRDSNLLATVLLSTNVGLLSWTNDGRTGGINNPSAEQIVTYISIICSVGSIVIGLIIFKQYRAKGADTPLRAVVVLKRILKEPFGLERLAIICSLPYVLLMWGLIAFLAAFGIVFYRDTGVGVRVPVTVVLAFLALCLFFSLYTAGPPEKEDRRARARSRKVENASSTEV